MVLVLFNVIISPTKICEKIQKVPHFSIESFFFYKILIFVIIGPSLNNKKLVRIIFEHIRNPFTQIYDVLNNINRQIVHVRPHLGHKLALENAL